MNRSVVFLQESENLVASVAAQAAVAIVNARLRDQQGRRIVAAEQDRSEQRELARQLSESAAIIACSNDPTISKDLNCIIRSWNPAAARVFGYTADEIVSHPILRVIPDQLQHGEPVLLSKIRSGRRLNIMRPCA